MYHWLKNTSIILVIILILRKQQLLIKLLLPNNKFCQACRFWVSHDQRQPGSILEEGRREDPGNEVVGGESLFGICKTGNWSKKS